MKNQMNRKDFIKSALATLAAAPLLRDTSFAQEASSAAAGKETAPTHDMSHFPENWTRPDEIIMILYPGFTALDLIGPQYFFGSLMGAKVHLAAKTLDPVSTDTKVSIVPTITFKDCPESCDVIFVPGACQGMLDAIEDEETMEFIRSRGAKARFVTSVCTGSIILGAAGLLEGYKATSHWVTRPLLHYFGAEEVNERVVADRNRITAAGVSAGLDLGLHLTLKLRDEFYARSMQLLAEYAPEPLFDYGTPDRFKAEELELIRGMFAGFVQNTEELGRKHSEEKQAR
ncbi:MAG: DJ-1/PfpI family protein [Verrucomicrobiales bacterium]